MPLRVHALCAYYPDHAHREVAKRSQAQWDAWNLCHAVKRREIKGYINTQAYGGMLRINGNNVGIARRIFGGYIRYVADQGPNPQCFFVPVPSKDSFSTEAFRSRLMVVEALGQDYYARVVPCLRFTAEIVPASQGGPRGYHAMLPHIACDRDMTGKTVLLVDDLATSGGSLLACRQRLMDAGANVIGAVVCGRTDTSDTPLKTQSWDLDDPAEWPNFF